MTYLFIYIFDAEEKVTACKICLLNKSYTKYSICGIKIWTTPEIPRLSSGKRKSLGAFCDLVVYPKHEHVWKPYVDKDYIERFFLYKVRKGHSDIRSDIEKLIGEFFLSYLFEEMHAIDANNVYRIRQIIEKGNSLCESKSWERMELFKELLTEAINIAVLIHFLTCLF